MEGEARKPGERRLQILQTLAAMLQEPQPEKIPTAAASATPMLNFGNIPFLMLRLSFRGSPLVQFGTACCANLSLVNTPIRLSDGGCDLSHFTPRITSLPRFHTTLPRERRALRSVFVKPIETRRPPTATTRQNRPRS